MRLDLQGGITFVNTFANKFYGYEEHEMIGRNILGFLLPSVDSKGNDLSPVVFDLLSNARDYHHVEGLSVLKNGKTAWVSWSNRAICDKDGNPTEILCVGNDITERKKAEEEKQRLERQLQRSQKMEAIGLLAGGVAHDLNNILSGVVSYPEILLMELPQESPMRKSLEVIKRSGEKAAAIVQDLLTLARRGVNISNVVNLNSVVRDFFKSPECSRILKYHSKVECELKLDPDLMNILGSEVHLSKTLMNLISNAAEAMEEGGRLKVSTENRYVDSLIQGYDLIEEGEYAVLTVEDTGIGIPPEDLKRIFEPFYSKKVMGRSGTGLGMAVIWSTVKDHQGFIDVKSKVGKGTCFELYFPITRRDAEDHKVYSLDALKGTEKILVVDDMADQREDRRTMLGAGITRWTSPRMKRLSDKSGQPGDSCSWLYHEPGIGAWANAADPEDQPEAEGDHRKRFFRFRPRQERAQSGGRVLCQEALSHARYRPGRTLGAGQDRIDPIGA